MSLSLRNRIYYGLKPLLPISLRRGLRRLHIRHLSRKARAVWPILESAARPPENWPGWHGGNQFALVLTHDVEGITGLNQCRQLMQLEMELGFRSSFNFIPEGGYRVGKETRDELTKNGFEVGVHDLHHDGSLYRSRKDFSVQAMRINQHLKEWQSVGFRSGFMLRQLDWLHDLDVHYDSSTFDTDPFEPQPDGAGTIFPFWVSRRGALKADGISPFPSGQGYVELPYTLPQDSTLFLMLRERSIEIWRRKLDWIAHSGGMALVNVHPDYITFGNAKGTGCQFPVALYKEFLGYLAEEFAGRYWNALPKEVASYFLRYKACLDASTGLNAFSRPPGANGASNSVRPFES